MENSSVSVKSTALSYGTLLGILGIALLVLIYVLNLNQNSYLISGSSFALSALIYTLGIKDYRSKLNGYITLSESLKAGMAIAVIGGLIGSIYAFIHYSFVYPEFIEMTLADAKRQMVENQPNMTEEQMQQALSFTKKLSTPFFLATFSLLGTLFFGFIISLVAGIFLKRKDPNVTY